jgi:hypothetical protein
VKHPGLPLGLILWLVFLSVGGVARADVYELVPGNTPIVLEIRPGEIKDDRGVRDWVDQVLGNKDAAVGKTGLNVFKDFARIVVFSAPEANAPDQSKMSAAIFECRQDLKAVYQQLQKDPDMVKEGTFHSILGYEALSLKADPTWKMVLLNPKTLLLGNQVLIDATLKVPQKKVEPLSKHADFIELRKRGEAKSPIWGTVIPSRAWRDEVKGNEVAKPLENLEFIIFGIELSPKPRLLVNLKLADAKALPTLRACVEQYLGHLKAWAEPAPKVLEAVNRCVLKEEGAFLQATLEMDRNLFEDARQQWEDRLQEK